MEYGALTSQGLEEILAAPESANVAVWCTANALSEAEFAKLDRGDVGRLAYAFAKADKATNQRALYTIEQHHPGERIWIEGVAVEA